MLTKLYFYLPLFSMQSSALQPESLHVVPPVPFITRISGASTSNSRGVSKEVNYECNLQRWREYAGIGCCHPKLKQLTLFKQMQY